MLSACRVTARVDYAVRAARELGVAHPGTLTAETIADRQALPLAFTKQILARMRRAGVVAAQRGGEGGYRLGLAPDQVSVADIVRAVEGPLADVRGEAPEELDYPGDGEVMRAPVDRHPGQPAVGARARDGGRPRQGRAAGARGRPHRADRRLAPPLTRGRSGGEASPVARPLGAELVCPPGRGVGTLRR